MMNIKIKDTKRYIRKNGQNQSTTTVMALINITELFLIINGKNSVMKIYFEFTVIGGFNKIVYVFMASHRSN